MKLYKKIERIPVRIFEYAKKKTGLRTYRLELIFVACILVVSAVVSGKGLVEWIGVCAVFFTFGHISVADRFREKEESRANKGEPISIECYKKLDKYYIAKEICWFAYFILLGAWSALVGVIVFLLYTPWRRLWRKYHSLS